MLAQVVALGGCGRASEAQWTFTWGAGDADTYDHDVWYESRVSWYRSKEAASFRSKSKAYVCKKRCKEHGATCAEECERKHQAHRGDRSGRTRESARAISDAPALTSAQRRRH